MLQNILKSWSVINAYLDVTNAKAVIRRGAFSSGAGWVAPVPTGETVTMALPATVGNGLYYVIAITEVDGTLAAIAGSEFVYAGPDVTQAPAAGAGYIPLYYCLTYHGMAAFAMEHITPAVLDGYAIGGAFGDVDGPASAVDNNLASFDGTTGKLIQDSGIGSAAVAVDLELPGDIYRFGFVTDYSGAHQTTIAFDGTNTFTLAPTGATWEYYRNGIKYTVTGSKTVTLSGSPPATKGLYYIYIDATDGTLTADTGGWTLEDTKVTVASVSWDNALTPKYWLADERHSCAIDRRYHWEHHFSDGTEVVTQPTLSGYTVTPAVPADTNNTFAITQSVTSDEDIKHVLAALSDPNGTSADYVVDYRTAASTWVWAASAMPYPYSGTYIQWDSAGTLTTGSGNKFYCSFLLLTNRQGAGRFAIIPGQAEHSTLAAARAETFAGLTKTGLQISEYVACYQLFWETSAAYSTKGKARMAAAPVSISVSASGASAPGSVSWGSIVGTLSSQTDLQAALDAKVTGPATATDSNLAAYDGTTGELIKDSLITAASVSSAVSASHARQHAITSTSDHTSAATSGQMLKADANGLPVDATNTDAQVSAAVTASHAAATVADTARIDMSITGQQISADIVSGSVTEGYLGLSDVTTGNATTSAHGFAPKATAPAANELNVLGIANGETTYANKDLFNTTTPAAIGTAAAGTEVQASRSDHAHTITLTGDVTTSAGVATTIANDAVTNAKLANMAQNTIKGRVSAGTGDPEDLTAANVRTVAGITVYDTETAQDAIGAMVDTTLVYTDATPALGRAAITGDVTISAGSNTAAIGSGVIVDADVNASAAIALSKLATQAANTFLANATTGAAVPTAIALAASRLAGRGATGNIAAITLGASLEFSAAELRRAALTGDVTASANSNATTIANKQSVTFTAPLSSTQAVTVIASAAPTISVAAASTSGAGIAPQATAPSASRWNTVAIANGETAYTNKTIREVLSGNRTYYVRTDGSDSNNGLANTAGGAFLTIQKAIDVVAGLDISIYDVTIQIADGTYSTTTTNTLKSPVGAGRVLITGNTTTPANVVVTSATSGVSTFYADHIATTYVLSGIKLTQTSGAGNRYGIHAIAGSKIQYSAMDFGATFTAHVRSEIWSQVEATGNYSITGAAARHIAVYNNGVARIFSGSAITVTLTGTPAFSSAFVEASSAVIAVPSGLTTFSGSATGTRYYAYGNGVISTDAGSSTFFPGNSAGVTATGGQYI